MKRYLWAIGYAAALLAFTLYVLLDTFVIPRVYTVVPKPGAEIAGNGGGGVGGGSDGSGENGNGGGSAGTGGGGNSVGGGESSTGSGSSADGEVGNASDGSIIAAPVIQIEEYRYKDTSIYVADVRLPSADYLKTAFAEDSYGRNITANTSVIAADHNAVLAINGDFYGSRESGYVIRNGALYRNTAARNQTDLVIYRDGSFETIQESQISAEQLLENGAMQVFSFGPALIENGEIAVSEEDEVGKAMASNPRTAIAMIEKLHYLFLVSDGRTKNSRGLSLYELAGFVQTLGAEIAYNLDGGGSSTMVSHGEVINHPTTNGRIKERSVSDIVFIGN